MRAVLISALKLVGLMALLWTMSYLCWWFSQLVSRPRGHRTPKPVILKSIYHVGHDHPWPTLRSVLLDIPPGPREKLGNPPVRIIIEDDLKEDRVTIFGIPNLTIEAAEGKKITWTPLAERPDRSSFPLLWVYDSQNLHLKGLTLDGNNQIGRLVIMESHGSAITLEEMTLKGFKDYGIVTIDCEGGEEVRRHILFKRLTFQSTRPDQTGIILTRQNRFLTFQDCGFEGPGVKMRTDGGLNMLSDIQFPTGVQPAIGRVGRR